MIAFRNYLWALYLPLSLLLAGPVHAQSAAPKPVRLPCGAGLVQQQYPAPKILNAAYSLAALRAGQLRIDFAGHSTFLITSPSGVKVATDYNDYYRAKSLPDIALMSSWHGNHSTDTIEASITHALRGWDFGSEETVEGFLHAAKRFFPVRRLQSGTLLADKSKLPKSIEIYFLLPPFFSQGL